MHQPLNATEALQLANDLVDRKEIEKEVIKWKKKHVHFKDEEDNICRTLGTGYWHEFMKRNSHLIVCKRGKSLQWTGMHGQLTVILLICTKMYMQEWRQHMWQKN